MLLMVFVACVLSDRADAFTPSDHVSFTLEGCRNDGSITLPNGSGQFICLDAAYTTGNLGKGWNELDLVPHRLTTELGNQSGATTDYNVYIAADYQTSGKTGYDFLSVPLVNAGKSDASCSVTAGPELTVGADNVVIYRELTIHQDKNKTCVFDYYERLSRGSHLYSGSSLQSYMFDQVGLSGSKKTVSIPVNEISPQELDKTMTATQDADFAWNVIKEPAPAAVSFGNTCDLTLPGDFEQEVTISVTMQVEEVDRAYVNVITDVYATNPASRAVTLYVTDTIYLGTTSLDTTSTCSGTSACPEPDLSGCPPLPPGGVTVAQNTTNALVLHHVFRAPYGTTGLNDIAKAYYADGVTCVEVPGQTTATASASVQITDHNLQAYVSDTEQITGAGLTFSADLYSGLPGNFIGYTMGVPTVGPITWKSDSQNACTEPVCTVGTVQFGKTVYLAGPADVTGYLTDTAVLTGSSGFAASAEASVKITADALVKLTITKTIPDPSILTGDDILTFTFDVCPAGGMSGDCTGSYIDPNATITFVAGDSGTKSVTLNGLGPGYYRVNEQLVKGFSPADNPQYADINLPTCSASLTFVNTTPQNEIARAQVKKVTDPTGYESGWSFTLSSVTAGCDDPSETQTTTDNDFVFFDAILVDGCQYTIAETEQPGWEFKEKSGCEFTVNYPADYGNVFECIYTNEQNLPLNVSKTASATFTRTHSWTISKTPNGDYWKFIGDPATTHGYTVNVDKTTVDSNWAVSGSIVITNPNTLRGVEITGVSDVFVGISASVDCGVSFPYTLAGSGTLNCTYNAALPGESNGANTATVATTVSQLGGTATADVNFADATITESGYSSINVTDSNGYSWSASDAAVWTYSKDFACSTNPADYVNGVDTDSYLNAATITQTGQSDSAKVTVHCYTPVVSKTAAGTYDERHEWDVTKTASPVSQSAFIGDTVSYEWTVSVTEEVSEVNFAVTGDITVQNPNPNAAMTVAVSDSVDGTAATLACGGILTVPAGSNATCGYTANPSNRDASVNTASATLNDIGFSASMSFGWTANVISGSATLDDDQNPAFPLDITDGGTRTYTEQYTCSTDKDLYEGDNTYSFGESNTATLTSGRFSDSSTASVTVDCYVPTISKTANGAYDEVHDWEVFKSVNTASQTAFAGEKKNFTWTVRVEETTFGDNYLVTGQITVVNPNPEDALTVEISDVLNDGTNLTIGPCTGGTWSIPNLTVPAGGTASCDYSGEPKGSIVAFNNELPNQVTMSVQYPYAGGPAYFPLVTVSGDAALNGYYEGWCIDQDHTIANNTNYIANVFSSYETLPAGLVEHPENFDLVNWIINQDFVYKPANDLLPPDAGNNGYGESLGNYTYGDVQRAIWELIDDSPFLISALNSWSQNRVNEIKAAAIANGNGFVPTCDDFVAVILQPVGGQQAVTIAEVSFASLGLDCADSNSVTAVINDILFTASADIVWTANKINETASLDDDQKLDWPTTVSADITFTYQDPQGYICSTDPAAYTNGYYQYNESNTAVLTFGNDSDTATASTAVKCYAPVVTKTAAGAYNERHEWDVAKSVTPTSQNAFAGDTVSYEWTVTVTEGVTEENFIASGTISIKNPRPDDGNMTVKLTDKLSDNFVATITGCTGGTWNATNKTVAVAPNTTAVCNFTASLTYSDDANAPTNNTVTAELMVGTTHFITAASDAIEWVTNVIRGSAELDDDQYSGFPLDITDGGTWKYSENYTCSTGAGSYTNGMYSFGENNTATVTSGDFSASANASTSVTCYFPQIELTKTGDVLSKITDKVYYDITLLNNTPVSLRALSCTISDPKIGFNKTVTLASGAKDENLDIEFTMPQTYDDPFVNTASVTCSPLNSTFSVSDSSSWSTNLFQPAIGIVKTGPAYATSGDIITYTFTITNLSSSDSPKLMLDSVSDNVLGDLKAAALTAGCDNLIYNGTCTFTANYTVPDVGLQPIDMKNIVTAHYHPAGFPNDVWDDDDHTVTIVPKGQLTDTSFCPLPNNQFRLLNRLEVAPNIYRLQASNPGQFYFNAFYYGTPGSDFTMTIQVPYPFVTQEGAGVPIQVHDGTDLTSSGCYMPTPSLSGFTIATPALIPTSSAGNQIITLEDYATKQLGQYTTVTVSGKVPATGLAYVTIHLDYGLKKTGNWKLTGTYTVNPVNSASIADVNNLAGFGSGSVTIRGYEVYDFARTVGGDTSTSTPSSYNEIKKFAGFLGFVINKVTGDPEENVKVVIYNPKNATLATLYTDQDGYYMYAYKHTAKAATYTLKLPAYNKSQAITVKANGFAAVDFELP